MTTPRLALPLLFAALLCSGCTSRVRDTGTLPGGYGSFNAHDSRTLKIRLVPEEHGAPAAEVTALRTSGERNEARDGASKPILFVVNEPQWLAGPDPWAEHPERREDLLFTIRERMYRYLLREYPSPTRVRYALLETDPAVQAYRVLTVETKVTDYREGNGTLRYLVGWGAGQSRLQLEGSIHEGMGAERRRVGEYAVRRGHGGYAQNGLNPAVLRSDYTLRYVAEAAIGQLAEELAEIIPPVLPAPAAAPDSSVASAPGSQQQAQ